MKRYNSQLFYRNRQFFVAILILFFVAKLARLCLSNKEFYPSLLTIENVLGVILLLVLIAEAIRVAVRLHSMDATFEKLIKEKKYQEIVQNSELIIENGDSSKIVRNAKLQLLVAYFYLGFHEDAKDLIYKTKWKEYTKHTYYFQILLLLFDREESQARSVFEKLKKVHNKTFSSQIDMCNKIFAYIDNPHEAVRIKSVYPIVFEIIKLYH